MQAKNRDGIVKTQFNHKGKNNDKLFNKLRIKNGSKMFLILLQSLKMLK